MPVGRERRLRTIQATRKPIWIEWLGIPPTARTRRIQWDKKNQISLGFTICTATCGNGARIGTERTTTASQRLRIQPGLRKVPFVCCVAVRGATIPCSAGRLSATGAIRSAAATSSVSVLCWCLRSGLRRFAHYSPAVYGSEI